MTDIPPDGWWEVDVVLRRASAIGLGAEAILGLVRESVAGMERPDDDRTFEGVRETYSYDIAPPEGSVGVSFWLRAASPGAAADAAYQLVQAACRAAIGTELPLWDIRLLPLDAVIGRDENPRPAGRDTGFRPAKRGSLRKRLLGHP